ncbi:MAG: hypothetical protein IMZ57_13470 [Acidobacteria bacterium]|nr:hypothetical protein [Acidobacteriota bacterium]
MRDEELKKHIQELAALKPQNCPKCGSDFVSVTKTLWGRFEVRCEDCDHNGPSKVTERAAIRDWNRMAAKKGDAK